jgi:hypothetical protein
MHTHWFPRSPATVRTPGIPSKGCGSGSGSESSLLNPEFVTLGTAVGIVKDICLLKRNWSTCHGGRSMESSSVRSDGSGLRSLKRRLETWGRCLGNSSTLSRRHWQYRRSANSFCSVSVYKCAIVFMEVKLVAEDPSLCT